MLFNLFTTVGLLKTGASAAQQTQAFKDAKNSPSGDAFATDPKYRNREDAVQNYVQHIRGMGWPSDLTEVLEMEAEFAPSGDAQQVYLHMLAEGPIVLADMQYQVAEIRNWAKVQNWLKQAAEASGATTQALKDASTGSIIKGTITSSAEDLKGAGATAGKIATNLSEAAKTGAETAAKNPWPTVIGIGLVLFGLRRAKII